MRELFAKRICEPRKSPHRHSHGQVLPFYKRSADMVRVGVALSNFGYNPRDAWWGVPGFGSVELPEVTEFLTDLVLAFGAGHGVSPLAFCEETSQNTFGSEAWVTPRLWISPGFCFSRNRGALC